MTADMQRFVEALRAFEKGEIVVVTDDDDRENEGDLVLAAAQATPEKLAFIVRHTSGIVCTPVSRGIARRLQLAPMVADNDAPLGTAFTVSVDYRPGLTTGISAEERCNTVRGIANPNAGADDFVRPGHVFPLIAKEGGVLIRSGHTEAAVDLCKLANLPPVGVICELVNDDGSVKRGADVARVATEHGLKMVSVADIIAWRQRSERLVERADEYTVETIAGPATAIVYRTPFDPLQHLALMFGDIGDGKNVTVRLHREMFFDDVFGERRAFMERTIRRVAQSKRGVIVYLREGSVGVAGESRRARDELTDGHSSALRRQAEWREIGLGAQILKDLGVSSIVLLTTRSLRYVGLDGFGIRIEGTEAP
jgi:3,4-dihydroxy 2-butanone 4-phosphate synthase/GTP cyclohydrolase II